MVDEIKLLLLQDRDTINMIAGLTSTWVVDADGIKLLPLLQDSLLNTFTYSLSLSSCSIR